jgi:hypothetical protein
MMPATEEALKSARALHDLDKIAVIRRYIEDGWDNAGYPYPGPGWMQGRYHTWAAYRNYMLLLDIVKDEMGLEL